MAAGGDSAVLFCGVGPVKAKFPACSADKTILLLQILHIFHSPDLLFVLSGFADRIVCRFHITVLSACFQIQIIPNAFVSGIRRNIPVACTLHSLDMLQERYERSAVCAIRESCHDGNLFTVYRQLYIIVCRLELTISHMVFFHPHEGGVLVRLGKTVPAASHFKQLPRVFLPALQQLVDFFLLPLLERFSPACSVYHLFAFAYKVPGKDLLLAPCQIALPAVSVKQFPGFLLYSGQLFLCALSSNKGVPVRHALNLCAVNKYFLVVDPLFPGKRAKRFTYW